MFQVRDKFPIPPGGMSRDHVMKSHKGDQWSFVNKMQYYGHSLVGLLAKYNRWDFCLKDSFRGFGVCSFFGLERTAARDFFFLQIILLLTIKNYSANKMFLIYRNGNIGVFLGRFFDVGPWSMYICPFFQHPESMQCRAAGEACSTAARDVGAGTARGSLFRPAEAESTRREHTSGPAGEGG